MKNFKNILWIPCLLALFASCKKDKLNIEQPVGLGGDVTVATAIDKWISDSLTKPYNIDVKYRWDPNALPTLLYRTVTPTDESKIIPLLTILKKLWIGPYNDVTGTNLFIKKYAPKQIVLIGSVEYNGNNQVVLGSADETGGVINLLDVNQHFFTDPYTSAIQFTATVQHEFAHILHENIIYPQDFIGTSSKLGLAGYTATWYNLTDAYALQQGYVTSYAMDLPREDFAETISYMLIYGKNKWEELKASTNPTARLALQQKEDYVVAYYKQSWNIDFYALQTKVQAALTALYTPPAVLDVFGYNETYSTASVNPANTSQLPLPAAFTTIYNAAASGLASVVSGGSSGRVLDSFDVYHNSAASVLLECYFHTPASQSAVQVASYLFNYTKDPANVFTFTLAGMDTNGTTFATGLTPLINYFLNNKFSVSWYADPSITIYPRIKFTPQTIPGTYFIAKLLP